MDIVETVDTLAAWRQRAPGRLGFVPTMGALHEGHLSLVRRARRECERVAVSIFVNPAQFGDRRDLASYPRTLDSDLARLQAERVDAVFTPTEAIIYPGGFSTWVIEEALTGRWEGASRPGHFRGVATVVLKLLNLVRPDRAYFGEKDYQQLRVVERMVHDLNVPTTIVACATIREPDGLAMSSRNVRLSPVERKAATVLWRVLTAVRTAHAEGEREAAALARRAEGLIRQEPLARIDYVAIADPFTLEPVMRVGPDGAVCCLAVWIGDVRLIDNLVLAVPQRAQNRSVSPS